MHGSYVVDYDRFKQVALSPASFNDLWNLCFSHVKIRKEKAVTGMFYNNFTILELYIV